MNIKEAKEQIKQAMTAYFSKDEFGNYEIPIEKQRPVFLVGAPGIGKTAIMEQIAQEMNVGLVSYSMTHHTRQSALGLPYIVKKTYGSESFQVSEYTMSEIIATVYEVIETTGVKEGILFLDEINCVSETLAPSMLQFLQYKIFGRHQVPAGWIVVTAGNPPEYNKSVREFDIVTMDRLKKITVEPDFDVWKEYAYSNGVHASVLTYLEIKKENFYKVETALDGKRFVTARGWEDLSQMIKLYEKHSIPVDEKLTGQYLQNPEIARDFAVYYDLFRKYQSDYQISEILSGHASAEVRDRARKARFDERLALLGLLLDAISQDTKEVLETHAVLTGLLDILKKIKAQLSQPEGSQASSALHPDTGQASQFPHPDAGSASSALHPDGRRDSRTLLSIFSGELDQLNRQLDAGRASHPLSSARIRRLCRLISILNDEKSLLARSSAPDFSLLKEDLKKRAADNQQCAAAASSRLEQLFLFCEEVFRGGQEMLILVTNLTVNEATASFISQYGCPKYFEHNKELLFYERNQEILSKLEALEL